MITYLINRPYTYANGVQKSIIEIACESTDTKPTGNVITGSLAVEVDTGDIYLFSEKDGDWNKMCSIKEEE